MYNTLEHGALFPGESFDPDTEFDSSTKLSGSATTRAYRDFIARLQGDAREVTGREDGKFTREDENTLAECIQAGKAFRERADELGESYDGRYDEDILKGEQARRDLVQGNMPFAAFMARASMGLVHRRKGTETIGVQRLPGEYMGKLRKPGTYSPIDRLKSTRADLEDRTQVAAAALWVAAEKHRPGKAKFVTYAAWHIQQTLELHTASEQGGWDLPSPVATAYRNALVDRALHGVQTPINHLTASGGKRAGNHPAVVFEGRESIPYAQAGEWAAEEEEGVFPDEPVVLALDEIVQDPGSSAEPWQGVEAGQRETAVRKMLGMLSTREAMVLSMRYGFDDGTGETYDAIGALLGVTRERVRQIEIKALSKLRAPSRSGPGSDYVFSDEPSILPVTRGSIADGTTHVMTRPQIARSQEDEDTEPGVRRPDGLESWQVYPDEPWEGFGS